LIDSSEIVFSILGEIPGERWTWQQKRLNGGVMYLECEMLSFQEGPQMVQFQKEHEEGDFQEETLIAEFLEDHEKVDF
jgi:hypothetical protein